VSPKTELTESDYNDIRLSQIIKVKKSGIKAAVQMASGSTELTLEVRTKD
jgi:hypothetical protein